MDSLSWQSLFTCKHLSCQPTYFYIQLELQPSTQLLYVVTTLSHSSLSHTSTCTYLYHLTHIHSLTTFSHFFIYQTSLSHTVALSQYCLFLLLLLLDCLSFSASLHCWCLCLFSLWLTALSHSQTPDNYKLFFSVPPILKTKDESHSFSQARNDHPVKQWCRK